MGHALEEAYRVLTADGVLVDLRPEFPAHERNRRRARQQILCVGESEEIPTGTLMRNLSGFRFTDRLLADMIRRGVFTLETRKTFWFRYYHRDLASFDLFRGVRWDNAIMTSTDRRLLERSVWMHPDMDIRVDTPMQLNVFKKGKGSKIYGS